MEFKVVISIKAILFGVSENIIGNLDIGNDYTIIKGSMIDSKLWREFDYTDFGIRRIYEGAKVNDNLDVAVLNKRMEITSSSIKSSNNGFMIDNQHINEYINSVEAAEIEYVDEKMRMIRLFSENSFNIYELLFNVFIVYENDDEKLYFNSKIPFPDVVYGNIPKLSLDNETCISDINDFIRNIQFSFLKSKFNLELLKKVCFLYDQTYTASVQTLRFMAGVIGIESLIVDDDSNGDLSYRFARNGAMLLSDNEDEYYDLKERLKRIYRLRSKYVHCGSVKNIDELSVIEVREILRKLIFKIIELNIDKKELLSKVEIKGYISKL